MTSRAYKWITEVCLWIGVASALTFAHFQDSYKFWSGLVGVSVAIIAAASYFYKYWNRGDDETKS